MKPIDRSQSCLHQVIVDELVADDHKVRAIWDLVGKFNLSGLLGKIKTREGKAGASRWDPRLLLSIWVYAIGEGVTSAREIERMMAHEPGMRWLAGMEEINHHTLSDFRVEHPEVVDQLLAELLGVLSQEGYVKLELVAHDGTKVRAQAGGDTFRREGTLEKEIAKAKQVIEEMKKSEAVEEGGERRRAAQERAARERAERLQEAMQQLEEIRKGKRSAQEKAEARVSLTEPEARQMKHGDNAIAPSYNVQLTTDAEHKIVVGVEVTQAASDSGELAPGMEEVKRMMGKYPEQAVADGGYTNQATIEKTKGKGIEFIGSMPEPEVRQAAAMKAAGIDPEFAPAKFVVLEEKQALECPAGKRLEHVGHSKKREVAYEQYRAQGSDCLSCEYQKQCCPRQAAKGRMVSVRCSENADVAEFREKMKEEKARAIYKQRGPVAEFPNAWIKEKFGLRKFRLRGLAKVRTEARWAVLVYNVMQYLRLLRTEKSSGGQAGAMALA